MRCAGLRGMLCLAAAIVVTSSALAADSFYVASSTNFGGIDISSSPTGISNAGIERLLEVNRAGDSVLGSYDEYADADSSSDSESSNSMAPIASTVDGTPDVRYLVAGVGAAFAMGLGLCFAGLMSGRRRTINTFTAGYVQLKK